jgi:hypothetical protein
MFRFPGVRPGHARGHRCPHPKPTVTSLYVAADRMILKGSPSHARTRKGRGRQAEAKETLDLQHKGPLYC